MSIWINPPYGRAYRLGGFGSGKSANEIHFLPEILDWIWKGKSMILIGCRVCTGGSVGVPLEARGALMLVILEKMRYFLCFAKIRPPFASSGTPTKPPVQNKRHPGKQWIHWFCVIFAKICWKYEKLKKFAIFKGGMRIFFVDPHDWITKMLFSLLFCWKSTVCSNEMRRGPVKLCILVS